MILKFELPEEAEDKISVYIKPEDIVYALPFDIDRGGNTADNCFVVAGRERIAVYENGEVTKCAELNECSKIFTVNLVGSAQLAVTVGGEDTVLARYSMKYVSKFAYLARGVQIFIDGGTAVVESTEEEKVCPVCGRAIPGTGKCPKCSGGGRMSRIAELSKPYVKNLLLISAVMLAVSFANIYARFVERDFIDNTLITNNDGVFGIVKYALLMILCYALCVAGEALRSWLSIRLGSAVSMDLREKMYVKIQRLSLSFVGSRQPGELMNKILWDTETVRSFIEGTLSRMLNVFLTMVFACVAVFAINWKLALICFAAAPVVGFVTLTLRKKFRRMYRKQWRLSDKVNSRLQDVLAGILVVKSYGREKSESEYFCRLTDDLARMQSRNEKFWSTFNPLIGFFFSVGTYLILYVGGLDVLTGRISVGELTQVTMYTAMIIQPLGWIMLFPKQVANLNISMDRIYDILDRQTELSNIDTGIKKDIEGEIEFRNTVFGYRSYEPVLDGIDFKVKPGEMIGIVGASGSGKSTMVNLIMRLYDCDDGSILVDGRDIRDYNQQDFHRQIGVVLQETFLFGGTVYENIKFGKPSATREEVIRAAKIANAHDFICRMPGGYDTMLAENGNNLSGGERQRVAIARAILNDPRILILDEATSSLDTETEYQIQEALKRLVKGRTTFAIAHRLSTLKNADRIIVIDGHKIAEAGTHSELLRKKGIYYGLVTAQLDMSKKAV